MPDDQSAIPASDAKRLFAGLARAPAIVLAVSGGPDSVALMWLAARWRRALAQGPRLVAVTVDHGLRPEAAREARDVKRLARSLDLPHHTLRWSGPKPSTGVPAAAREARYGLLAQAARKHGATHILTAHTRDDQAETLLMRMLRGSGVAGLSAMARETERDGVMLTRPLLDISKAQLIATLKKARISFADDPTNRDPSFTRPRLRALMPLLAEEGGDARNLARLAARIARANAALEVLVDGAERYLALKSEDNLDAGFDAALFAVMPDEIRLRLLKRAIDRTGHEGPAELGKVETLLAAVDEAVNQALGHRESKLKQTLAGAVISVASGRIRIGPAPPRRARSR
ncbi:tRNA lysidine(34) synthetase TilS [uncultured Bradyrhizobium sp.]|uniref:tRNA lysidine(34) synthetase TilS n=1 Tax=Bradyrhizobium sp. TaxID=376 RepID=UPI00261961C8|nr:tRNA lysidine(34) synthetase TilS [uncultured Bradyrhizobium sp.]